MAGNQVNINVTDTIPPENFATIDKGTMIGNTFTKEQDEEWREGVESELQSAVKGIAVPGVPYDPVTNPIPTPYDPTAHPKGLYEKYDVKQAGTFLNFRDSNDEDIIVTQLQLEENWVQIWVKNGVSQLVLKELPVKNWIGTRNEYDAIPVKDPTVFYFVENEEGDYVTAEYLDGVSIQNDPENIGILDSTSSGFNKTTNGYYILNKVFTTPKSLEKISFPFDGVGGTMNFVIGTIEQAGRFVERKSFSKPVVNGVNVISVNEIMQAGEVFGIKTPGLIPNYGVVIPNPNIVYATESGYNAILEQWTYWTPAIQIVVKTVVVTGDYYIKNSKFQALENEVSTVKLSANTVISPNGSKFKIKVDNNGVLSTEKIGNYKNVLHFGNSILRHPIIAGVWWGDWGMAASEREFDYNHQLLEMLQVDEPTAITEALNIAPWELNPSTYNKANFDSVLALKPYDLFVLRVGENATFDSNYKQNYKDLVLYAKSKLPSTCRIVIGGLFWANAGKENAMSEVAQELGLTFVSMAGLETTANKSFIGDIVQGDDGNPHTVDNAGVANHPNNAGMLAIAERLFNGINS